MSDEHQAWKNDPNYDAVHAERFRLSWEWLQPYVRPEMTVVELGGASSFSRKHFDSTKVINEERDLRYAKEPLLELMPWEQADLILCMEVFEHLHDQETKKPTEWRATGTRAMLRAALANLKPGGLLFLTTPNACSLNVLFKVLTMQAPMVYRPHVREYSPEEIVGQLTAAGFIIERFETLDVWGGGCTGTTRTIVEKLLADYGHPSPHRGEDIFVLARKPSTQTS